MNAAPTGGTPTAEREPAPSSTDETLRRFVDEAPVAIAMLDRDLRYLAASRPWLIDYGLDASAYLGRHHYELFPEVPEHWKAVNERCLAGAVESCDSELFVRADGTRQWIRWAVQPWRTARGACGGLLFFTENITARVEAETALRAQAELSRLALDAAGAGVWTYDARTNTGTWDDRFQVQYGFSANAPRSFEAWVASLHEQDQPRVLARVDEVRRTPGDDTWDIEFRAVRPDGSLVWMHGLGRATRDANGEVIDLIGLNWDVTARKQAEEALSESHDRERRAVNAVQLLLETATQGIVFVDASGRIAGVNASLAAMFGWDAAELVGQPIEQLLPEAAREGHEQHRAGYFESPRPRPMGLGIDLVGQRKDGSAFPVEVSLNHVVTEDGGRAVAFVTDITARKQAEHALRLSHDALAADARELADRANQLRRLATELTLVEQRTREQLAKSLHDGLQQLLFSSKLKLDRLVARLADGRDVSDVLTSLREELDDAIGQARSLAVDLSPPTLHTEGLPGGLRWLAEWAQRRYQLTVDLTIDRDADPGDRNVRILVFESVRELLFNVVKHARATRVAVDLARTPGGSVTITVRDEGVGFDSTSALGAGQAQGPGLGLFSIRERLLLLGGRLDAESHVGQGSTFTIVVPSAVFVERRRSPRPPPHHPAVSETRRTEARPLTIVIADDHAIVRDGLRQLFAGHPALQVVGEAVDGTQAVAQAHALEPDVIVMDVSMPNMSGIEATRRIRAELPSVLIFGLSTEERTEALHAIEEAGAAGYFTKGDDAQKLRDRLLALQSSLRRPPARPT